MSLNQQWSQLVRFEQFTLWFEEMSSTVQSSALDIRSQHLMELYEEFLENQQRLESIIGVDVNKQIKIRKQVEESYSFCLSKKSTIKLQKSFNNQIQEDMKRSLLEHNAKDSQIQVKGFNSENVHFLNKSNREIGNRKNDFINRKIRARKVSDSQSDIIKDSSATVVHVQTSSLVYSTSTNIRNSGARSILISSDTSTSEGIVSATQPIAVINKNQSQLHGVPSHISFGSPIIVETLDTRKLSHAHSLLDTSGSIRHGSSSLSQQKIRFENPAKKNQFHQDYNRLGKFEQNGYQANNEMVNIHKENFSQHIGRFMQYIERYRSQHQSQHQLLPDKKYTKSKKVLKCHQVFCVKINSKFSSVVNFTFKFKLKSLDSSSYINNIQINSFDIYFVQNSNDIFRYFIVGNEIEAKLINEQNWYETNRQSIEPLGTKSFGPKQTFNASKDKFVGFAQASSSNTIKFIGGSQSRNHKIWSKDMFALQYIVKPNVHTNKHKFWPSEFVLIHRDQLHELERIKIPRWIFTTEIIQLQLHGFGDTSNAAYTAVVWVVYSRVVQSDDENPADWASRGVFPSDLGNHNLWWHGPDWLSKAQSEWPSHDNQYETELEKKKQQVYTFHTGTTYEDDYLVNVMKKHSTLSRLLWTSAFVTKFCSSTMSRPRKKVEQPNAQDLREALIRWTKYIQLISFNEEIVRLRAGEELLARSKLKKLRPFIDKNGLLRVGGRLSKSELVFNAKHPIILPKNNYFTTLIINQAHKYTLHGGPTLMSSFLQNYWIFSRAAQIRKVIGCCVTCFTYQSKPAEQIMADLPSSRVTQHRAFLNSGVDLAGPIITKSYTLFWLGTKKQKEISFDHSLKLFNSDNYITKSEHSTPKGQGRFSQQEARSVVSKYFWFKILSIVDKWESIPDHEISSNISIERLGPPECGQPKELLHHMRTQIEASKVSLIEKWPLTCAASNRLVARFSTDV